MFKNNWEQERKKRKERATMINLENILSARRGQITACSILDFCPSRLLRMELSAVA